ncbi:MAG: hypothetical protein ACI4QW_04720 [Clostridia bacterium]
MKMSFIGGVIAGAIVGSALTMVIDPVSDRQRRKLHKGTHSMFKTMGTVLDAMMTK